MSLSASSLLPSRLLPSRMTASRADAARPNASWGRSIRRRVRGMVLPAVLFLFAAYFGWQATRGSRGLHAYAERKQEEKAALAELKTAKHDLAVWERRVSALRGDHLDLDVLDERVRAMLNLSQPNDIIVPYGPGKKLF